MKTTLLNIFFEGWSSIAGTSLTTVLAYIALIFFLRVSGKRTLAKMNAFDFVVTVALGSTFATVALSKDVPLADGIMVFLLLIAMQFIISWLSVRTKVIKNLVTSQPSLLLYRGEVLNSALKKERVSLEELYAAIRSQGISDLKDIDAIVMETTGDLTVISKINSPLPDAMKDVKKHA